MRRLFVVFTSATWVPYSTDRICWFDDEAGGVEVDVAPRQAEHLAASHAGVGGEVDRHVPLAVLDAGEELAQLVG